MRAWNISNDPVEYRGRTINPGCSLDFDAPFLPTRDQKLHNIRLFFGDSLPQWYTDQKAAAATPAPVQVAVVDEVQPYVEANVVVAPIKKK